MRIKKLWGAWWDGEYIPPNNSPSSYVWFLMGHQKRHWSSNAAHAVVAFCVKEWKWLIGAMIAIAAIVVRLR